MKCYSAYKTVATGFACLLMCVISIPSFAADPVADWSRFRGENSSGYVAECSVPIPWTPSDVAWQVELPGQGNGSPVVQGSQVFLMSADPRTAERYLLCHDLLTGRELWRRAVKSQPHNLHARSSYASSTPCVGPEAVYFTWGSPASVKLAAVSLDGKTVLWERDFGSYVSQHGYGASPALFGDKLVLFNSQQADQLDPGQPSGRSRVTTVDAKSGETLWETDLTTTRVCYGVPSLYRDLSGRNLLLFANTGDGLFALDLENGAKAWSNRVFAKRSVSSPQVTHGLAIGTEGSGGGGNILYAVDLEGDHSVKFKITRAAPYVPTPVVKDDLMFLWGDSGIVSCVELPSGNTVWTARVGGTVSSSPVVAGDKLVGISQEGRVTALSATREAKEIGSIELGETIRSTPLLSDSYMLIRTDSRLICVGKP